MNADGIFLGQQCGRDINGIMSGGGGGNDPNPTFDSVTIGTSPTHYILPLERGNEFDVMQQIGTAGEVEWTNSVQHNNLLTAGFTYRDADAEVEFHPNGTNHFRRAVDNNQAVKVNTWKARGTIDIPTAVLDGDFLAEHSALGHDGSFYHGAAKITVRSTDNWVAGGGRGATMRFLTTPSGINGPLPVMELDGYVTAWGQRSTTGYTQPILRGSRGQVLKLSEDESALEWTNLGMFSQFTSDSSVGINNSEVETVLETNDPANHVVGSMDIESGEMDTGDCYRLFLSGNMETEGKDQDIRLRLYTADPFVIGAYSVLYDTGIMDLDDVKTQQSWEFIMDMQLEKRSPLNICHTVTHGKFTYSTMDGGAAQTHMKQHHSDINVIKLNDMYVTVQWGDAEINNAFYLEQMYLTKVF